MVDFAPTSLTKPSTHTSKNQFPQFSLQRTLDVTNKVIWIMLVIEEKNLLLVPDPKAIAMYELNTTNRIGILYGHFDSVLYLIYLSDGRVASSSGDETIRIWNLGKRSCDMVLRGHHENIWTLLELPNRFLLSLSSDQTLKLWDLKSDKASPVQSIDVGLQDIFYASVMLEKGLFAYSEWGNVQIMKSKSLKNNGIRLIRIKNFVAHHYPITDLQYIKENEQLISSGHDAMIKIWSTRSWRLLRTLSGHKQAVFSVGALDLKFVVSVSKDRTLKCWNKLNGKIVDEKNHHEGFITAVNLLSDRRLVSAGEDGDVYFWEQERQDAANQAEKKSKK